MVVKSRRGRRRYIVFECSPPFDDRDEAVHEVNSLFGEAGMRAPHVIDTGEWHLMIRCSPSQTEGVINVLSGADRGIRPLRTSGTLRKLRTRYKLSR